MKLDKKRRQENRTNYQRRLILLKGGLLRLTVRKSNKYITIQIIESKNAKDKVIKCVSTKELLKFGWPENKNGSLKSIPASYLGGYLMGKKAKDIKNPVILDCGLIPNTKGSKIYAVVKGAFDSGIKINFNEKVIPSKEMIEGKYTSIDETTFNKVKGNIK